MTSPVSYPAASTPDASVHTAPTASTPSTISPEYFLAVFEGFVGAIAIAISGVGIDGVDPLFFLRSFGQELETQAATAIANAATAQATATGAQTTSDSTVDTITSTLTGTTGTSGDTTGLASAVSPLTFLGNLAQAVDDLFSQLSGRVATLESGATAVAASGGSLVGFTDQCNDATNFTAVSPTAALQPTGWGALFSPAGTLSVDQYNTAPSTNRPRIGFQLKARTPGYNWVHICAASDMSLFVALLFTVAATGPDTVSLVLGTGPSLSDLSEPLTTYQTRIANESFWEVAYDPYAEVGGVPVANSNTVFVFCNGDPVTPLQFQDDGNLAMHGAGFMDWGVMADGGFSITKVTGQDWTGDDPQ